MFSKNVSFTIEIITQFLSWFFNVKMVDLCISILRVLFFFRINCEIIYLKKSLLRFIAISLFNVMHIIKHSFIGQIFGSLACCSISFFG